PGVRASQKALDEALERTVRSLRQGLKDPNPKGRLTAVEAIESLEDRGAPLIPDLLPLVQDGDRFVRWATVRTLGRLAPLQATAVVPQIQTQLLDPDLDLRLVAATALSRFGPQAAPALANVTRSVQNGDPDIRIAA